ncbi:TetR/AcrR family transcriptional regulator [Rhodococcus sp. C26F]
MRSIARHNGVTAPTSYYHQSKEAVLVALLDAAAREVIERATTARDEEGDDVRAQFTNVIESFVLSTTQRVELAFLDLELRSVQTDAKTYPAACRELHALLADIIHEGVSTTVVNTSEPHEAAHALLGMCRSSSTGTNRWRAHNDGRRAALCPGRAALCPRRPQHGRRLHPSRKRTIR